MTWRTGCTCSSHTCLSSPSEPPGRLPLAWGFLGWGGWARWTGCGNTSLTSRQPAEKEQGAQQRLTPRMTVPRPRGRVPEGPLLPQRLRRWVLTVLAVCVIYDGIL